MAPPPPPQTALAHFPDWAAAAVRCSNLTGADRPTSAHCWRDLLGENAHFVGSVHFRRRRRRQRRPVWVTGGGRKYRMLRPAGALAGIACLAAELCVCSAAILRPLWVAARSASFALEGGQCWPAGRPLGPSSHGSGPNSGEQNESESGQWPLRN